MVRNEEHLEMLENGDFLNAVVLSWFNNHDFSWIYAAIDGCNQKLNYDLLNSISMNALRMAGKPIDEQIEASDLLEIIKSLGRNVPFGDQMTRSQLINTYNYQIGKIKQHILTKVIEVAYKNNGYYGGILLQLASCDDDFVRLQCCAKTNLFPMFLNDSSKRVGKVAHIRNDFRQKMTMLSDDGTDKQRIMFLSEALKKGDIKLIFGDVLIECPLHDKIQVAIDGPLIKAYYAVRDKDVFETISDSDIRADALDKLLSTGEIKFVDGANVPEYFGNRQFS